MLLCKQVHYVMLLDVVNDIYKLQKQIVQHDL